MWEVRLPSFVLKLWGYERLQKRDVDRCGKLVKWKKGSKILGLKNITFGCEKDLKRYHAWEKKKNALEEEDTNSRSHYSDTRTAPCFFAQIPTWRNMRYWYIVKERDGFCAPLAESEERDWLFIRLVMLMKLWWCGEFRQSGLKSPAHCWICSWLVVWLLVQMMIFVVPWTIWLWLDQTCITRPFGFV